MTKDVWVSVKGLHHVKGAGNDSAEDVQDDEVEVFSPGTYHLRNGKHYVEYEEMDEESGEVMKNRITLRDRHLEVLRRGTVYTKMIFEENSKNVSWYNTPAGNLLAGFDVGAMQVSESEELIEITVEYALELNYEHVSDSRIRIRIMTKDHLPPLSSLRTPPQTVAAMPSAEGR
ncbi:MAG: DUF1934 domain-containing protein [Lachnospiraceae bacterium]|nr:DUF1934 domain-containing protein [Lachnospiraceae bacterium]